MQFPFAGVAFSLDLIKSHIVDTTQLPGESPSPLVSNVSLITPEISIPDPGAPVAPNELMQQLVELQGELTSPDLHLALSTSQANKLIELCHRSKALDSMDSPFVFVDLNGWMKNISTAVATIRTSYSRVDELSELKEIMVDKSINDSQRDERFTLRGPNRRRTAARRRGRS